MLSFLNRVGCNNLYSVATRWHHLQEVVRDSMEYGIRDFLTFCLLAKDGDDQGSQALARKLRARGDLRLFAWASVNVFSVSPEIQFFQFFMSTFLLCF